MADKIQLQYNVSAATVYVIVRNTAAQAWTGAVFQTYVTANLGNYDIPLTEQGTSSKYYTADFPSAIPAGVYSLTAFKQLGGSPAETDTILAGDTFAWDGAAVASAATVNLTKWAGTTIPAPLVAGVPKVDVTYLVGQTPDPSAVVPANVTAVLSSALTEGAAGRLAAALTTFLDVAVPTLTVAGGNVDGFTIEQVTRVLAAALAGKLSGAGTGTETFRNLSDTKNRIVANVDGDGNRLTITLDMSP